MLTQKSYCVQKDMLQLKYRQRLRRKQCEQLADYADMLAGRWEGRGSGGVCAKKREEEAGGGEWRDIWQSYMNSKTQVKK